jgi:hypothetical protein
VKSEDITFEFPIKNTDVVNQMKNIMHFDLPNFHDLVTEDLENIFFKFDILYKSYDYISDSHKLNHFPSTLKNDDL